MMVSSCCCVFHAGEILDRAALHVGFFNTFLYLYRLSIGHTREYLFSCAANHPGIALAVCSS
jgi:hypothetical protein